MISTLWMRRLSMAVVSNALMVRDEQEGALLKRPDRFISTASSGLVIDNSRVVPPASHLRSNAGQGAYAIARRKDAVARVWIKPGSGRITVNRQDEAVHPVRTVLRGKTGGPIDNGI